jgi:hypothetical protein
LTLDQAHLAEQCLQAGLRPEELKLRVDGLRAVERLRSGESAATVASRLREQSVVDPAPAPERGRGASSTS